MSKGVASIDVDSSLVNVRMLTGDPLFSSISSAMDKLCPKVTQTDTLTQYNGVDKIPIKNIAYSEKDLEETILQTDGILNVQILASSYNDSKIR